MAGGNHDGEYFRCQNRIWGFPPRMRKPTRTLQKLLYTPFPIHKYFTRISDNGHKILAR